MNGPRVLITGGPRTGKTTLSEEIASKLGVEARHTDSLIGMHSWSEVSRIVAADWIAAPGPWVIEGVAVPRAIRKWLAAHPSGKPCDSLIWRPHAFVALSAGQARMTRGCMTVMHDLIPEIKRRGVEMEVS